MFTDLNSGFTINLVALQANTTIFCANIRTYSSKERVGCVASKFTNSFLLEKIGQTMRYRRFNSCVFLIPC